MTAKTQRQKSFEEGRGYTRQDWEAVTSPELSADELARMKPAKAVLPPAFFEQLEKERRSRGRPRLESAKEAVTLRMAPETVAKFRNEGANWRTRMQATLQYAGELQHDIEQLKESLAPLTRENGTVSITAEKIEELRSLVAELETVQKKMLLGEPA